jgi:hypothetical protein
MTTSFLIGTILTIIYGGLSILSGAIELRARNIPIWSAITLILGGVGILCSPYFIYFNSKYLLALIFCLVLMHVPAIVNGFYLHGKINKKHHLIRFTISLMILVLFL